MAHSSLSILPKVSKLSPRVIRILGCNPSPMTLQGTNTYIIGTGRSRILFDTGDGQKPEFFLNLKKSLNFDRITLNSIILSHWHDDHVGGVQEVLNVAEKGCQVYKFPRSDVTETNSFNKIVDGQTFEVEGATLTAIHTPGHTTDHVILHLKEDNSIFSGDCILGEGTTVFEDLHDYMLSLKKILEIKPKTIYPGHGPVISDPIERLEYYISHREERERQIVEALKSGPAKKSPMDIVKIVYTETSEDLYPAAAKNVIHHLEKLVKEGKVKQDEDLFWTS